MCNAVDAVFRTIQQSNKHIKLISVGCAKFITFIGAYITTIRSSDKRTKLVTIGVSICYPNSGLQ